MVVRTERNLENKSFFPSRMRALCACHPSPLTFSLQTSSYSQIKPRSVNSFLACVIPRVTWQCILTNTLWYQPFKRWGILPLAARGVGIILFLPISVALTDGPVIFFLSCYTSSSLALSPLIFLYFIKLLLWRLSPFLPQIIHEYLYRITFSLSIKSHSYFSKSSVPRQLSIIPLQLCLLRNHHSVLWLLTSKRHAIFLNKTFAVGLLGERTIFLQRFHH